MESNSYGSGLHMSGNLSAECTLLITDQFGLFPNSFSKLLPLLETRYRVVTYNDNGFDIFNRTKHLRHNTLQGYANDLIAALEKQGIQNVIYIAHSVNAMLAFQAAAYKPHLFEKIVLLSAMPNIKSDLAVQFLTASDQETDVNVLFDHILQLQQNSSGSSEQLPALLAAYFATVSMDKAKQVFTLIMTTDNREYLDKLTIPVMILQGIADKTATAETAYLMHRRIPESYLIKIRAKGHLPQLNAPEEVFKAMEIFMYPVVC